MKRFKNILVVFDSQTDNRSLLNHAVLLAQRNQAALTVVDVFDEAPSNLPKSISQKMMAEVQKLEVDIIEEFPSETPSPPVFSLPADDWKDKVGLTENPPFDIWEYVKQEEQRSLDEFVAGIQHAGIPVNVKTLYGIPFIKIIQEVLHNKYDLVMITADGKGGLKEALIGNTSMHLMRKCPCPVWVIKPGQPRQFERIIAAVDLVQEDSDRGSINTKIIELATSLARYGQSELFIFHAWRLYGESIIRGQGGASPQQLEELLHETKSSHRKWLIELLNQHPLKDLNYTVYLLKGEAEALITNLIRSKSIDLIVMGTVSRAGISGLLIGNTAEKVLQKVDCSVLTIKPDGFVTPVELDRS